MERSLRLRVKAWDTENMNIKMKQIKIGGTPFKLERIDFLSSNTTNYYNAEPVLDVQVAEERACVIRIKSFDDGEVEEVSIGYFYEYNELTPVFHSLMTIKMIGETK